MKIRTLIFLKLSLLLLCTLPSLVGAAGRVAIMPVEDLSRGDNGLNMTMTRLLHKGLASQGVSLLPPEEMETFMVRKRLRSLGQIDSRQLQQLGRDTHVKYILLSTITQRRDTHGPAVALTMDLVQVEGGATVWSASLQACQADEKHLFGLAEPDSLATIEDLLLQRMMALWPANPAILKASSSRRPVVDFVHLSPRALQPGNIVSCRFKVDRVSQEDGTAKPLLMVNNKAIDVHYRSDENDFIASWPAPALDGHYPVHLLVDGGKSKQHEQLIGSFVVDSAAPQLALQLKGEEYQGETILQHKVSIHPRFRSFEAITRWQVSVLKDGENIILETHGQGSLPAGLTWWGQEKNGTLAVDGAYEIVLEAWDIAGNKGQVRKDVRVMRTPPKVEVALQRTSRSVSVKLAYNGDLPLDQWQMELRNSFGEVVVEKSGFALADPQVISVELPALPGELSCQLTARDVVGNTGTTSAVMVESTKPSSPKRQGLFMAEALAVPQEIVLSEVWLEDF